MSLSRPFFNTAAKPSRPLYEPVISEEDYRQLHWSEQLELRPLGSRPRRDWPEGDFNTRIDNWDDPEGEQ